MMPESVRDKLVRWRFNLFPAFRSTGAWITYIADDYREIRIALPLTWRTRNYVGTMFGGSIYAATDGVYMIMLMKSLGPDYVAWDKQASVRFRKPGRTTLFAHFVLPAEELEIIRATLASSSSIDRTYPVVLVNRAGTVHAEIETTIHIRRRDAP